MSKFEKAALILKDHQEWRLGGDGEPTNPQALTSAVNHAIEALTQAAEIERGDKVVVDREPSEEMCQSGKDEWNKKIKQGCVFKVSFCHHIYKAMITASEGK